MRGIPLSAKTKPYGRQYSEYEIKWTLRYTLHTFPMSIEMAAAALTKKNMLDDIYKFYTESNKDGGFFGVCYDYLRKIEAEIFEDEQEPGQDTNQTMDGM
jgi:hypothetical protein